MIQLTDYILKKINKEIDIIDIIKYYGSDETKTEFINHDTFTIKRFKQEKNIVMLMPQSYNPEHQTQIYDLKQDDVEIVGKVVECKVGF